ncbi:MAG: hypothetical protein AAGA48_24890 [Myxococcota bacterium]
MTAHDLIDGLRGFEDSLQTHFAPLLAALARTGTTLGSLETLAPIRNALVHEDETHIVMSDRAERASVISSALAKLIDDDGLRDAITRGDTWLIHRVLPLRLAEGHAAPFLDELVKRAQATELPDLRASETRLRAPSSAQAYAAHEVLQRLEMRAPASYVARRATALQRRLRWSADVHLARIAAWTGHPKLLGVFDQLLNTAVAYDGYDRYLHVRAVAWSLATWLRRSSVGSRAQGLMCSIAVVPNEALASCVDHFPRPLPDDVAGLVWAWIATPSRVGHPGGRDDMRVEMLRALWGAGYRPEPERWLELNPWRRTGMADAVADCLLQTGLTELVREGWAAGELVLEDDWRHVLARLDGEAVERIEPAAGPIPRIDLSECPVDEVEQWAAAYEPLWSDDGTHAAAMHALSERAEHRLSDLAKSATATLLHGSPSDIAASSRWMCSLYNAYAVWTVERAQRVVAVLRGPNPALRWAARQALHRREGLPPPVQDAMIDLDVG